MSTSATSWYRKPDEGVSERGVGFRECVREVYALGCMRTSAL